MKVTLFLVENGQSNKAAMPHDWLSEVYWAVLSLLRDNDVGQTAKMLTQGVCAAVCI